MPGATTPEPAPTLRGSRLARLLVRQSALGSAADWTLFAAAVVVLDGLLDATVWATTLVLAARLLPGVLFAPLAARRTDRADLARSLRWHEPFRVLAIVAVGAGYHLGVSALVLVGLLTFEYVAAMQAAGREAVVSRHVPGGVHPAYNTANIALSYGMLPVGAAVVHLAGLTVAFVLAATAYLVVVAGWWSLRLGSALTRTAAPADVAAGTTCSWRKTVVVASLGAVPAVALFVTAPSLAATWLGTASVTAPLYALVLAGAALGAVLVVRRNLAPSAALLIAGTGSLVAVAGAWPLGLPLIGAGAGGAYIGLQTRLQREIADPSRFAAAFAALKVAVGGAAVAAPALYALTGPEGLLLVATVLVLAAVGVEVGAQRLVRTGIEVLLRSVLRVHVVGRPHAGAGVVVANHPSVLDGPVAMLADRSLRPVAKWQPHRGARLAIWAAGSVVTQGPDPRPALAPAVEHLRAGGRIWLAPEGGLTPADKTRLGPCRTGAARMAAAADVPVQVTAIRYADGPAGPGLRHRWRGRRRAAVVWGPVLRMTGDAQVDTARIAEALAALADLAPPRDERVAAGLEVAA